jgi:hypothetical protein
LGREDDDGTGEWCAALSNLLEDGGASGKLDMDRLRGSAVVPKRSPSASLDGCKHLRRARNSCASCKTAVIAGIASGGGHSPVPALRSKRGENQFVREARTRSTQRQFPVQTTSGRIDERNFIFTCISILLFDPAEVKPARLWRLNRHDNSV